MEDALKKLEENNQLASASNRTSSKNTEVMNSFKNDFEKLVKDYVKSGKFKKDDKRITVKNVDGAIRIPKMYFASNKDSTK